MSNPISIDKIQESLIDIQGQKVLLDSAVAEIYGVETKRISEAVKNKPDKFPTGYVIQLNKQEFEFLRC